jgi:hypothetical protein
VRFTGDVLFCRAARFERLRREFGDGFEAIAVSGRAAKQRPEPPHSVLTLGLIDREGEPPREAMNKIIGFLSDRLQ